MEKNMDLEVQEQELQKRLDRLEAIEAEIKDREKKLKEKEKAKKRHGAVKKNKFGSGWHKNQTIWRNGKEI